VPGVSGRRVCVDGRYGLGKFFDTVNQSKLIQVLSKDIKDERVISLIYK